MNPTDFRPDLKFKMATMGPFHELLKKLKSILDHFGRISFFTPPMIKMIKNLHNFSFCVLSIFYVLDYK